MYREIERRKTELTERLKDTRHRLRLTSQGMAAYLGVSPSTYSSWETGLREPAASAVRLLDVLAQVEAMAPGLHEAMLP